MGRNNTPGFVLFNPYNALAHGISPAAGTGQSVTTGRSILGVVTEDYTGAPGATTTFYDAANGSDPLTPSQIIGVFTEGDSVKHFDFPAYRGIWAVNNSTGAVNTLNVSFRHPPVDRGSGGLQPFSATVLSPCSEALYGPDVVGGTVPTGRKAAVVGTIINIGSSNVGGGVYDANPGDVLSPDTNQIAVIPPSASPGLIIPLGDFPLSKNLLLVAPQGGAIRVSYGVGTSANSKPGPGYTALPQTTRSVFASGAQVVVDTGPGFVGCISMLTYVQANPTFVYDAATVGGANASNMIGVVDTTDRTKILNTPYRNGLVLITAIGLQARISLR